METGDGGSPRFRVAIMSCADVVNVRVSFAVADQLLPHTPLRMRKLNPRIDMLIAVPAIDLVTARGRRLRM